MKQGNAHVADNDAAAAKRCRCARHAEVGAYLDGEAEACAAEFENHLTECASCRAILNEQRRVLIALESAFDARGARLELPRAFAQGLAARARADVGSVRERGERRRALAVTVALMFVTFLLLPGASRGLVVERCAEVLQAVGSVFNLVWQMLADVVGGVVVVLRVCGDLLPVGAGVAPQAMCAAIMLFALLLLLRLINSYRREFDS